jgi:hypothetical protein
MWRFLLFSGVLCLFVQNNASNAAVCFATTAELRQAILDYAAAPSNPSSAVAVKYGYPIANWCVSSLTSFKGVFQDVTLNQALTNWDTSKAVDM